MGSPVVDPPTQPPQPDNTGATATPEPKTGPLDALGAWFANLGKGKASAQQSPQQPTQPQPVLLPVKPRTSIENMQNTVGDFDEDYRNLGERLLCFF